ncbi:GATA transcription factor 4-like [Wolffia australiana]
MGKMPIMGMEASGSSFSNAYMCGLPSSDAMRIDDLLDFSEQEDLLDAASNVPESILPMQDATAYLDAPPLCPFSDDLYIPSEEAAELEWLSRFVDDSFSDIPFPAWINGGDLSTNSIPAPSDASAVPSRARSKRSKASSASWSSPQQSSSSATSSSSSSSSDFPREMAAGGKKKDARGEDSGARRCTHCASEKTPQWRTGPLGPKTLCNACGVRFKSGRLVPEYRPAASPTFVLTQHSNSHRKVLELRRQKDLVRQQATCSSPELLYRDYEVC